MPGAWEEAKHPRATDGKFGEGGGAPESPAGKRPKRATPAARARIAAARAKAGAKAKKIVSDARMRAKATVLAAAVKRGETVAKAKASGKKLTPKQRERIAVARTKAKAKAADIIAKAKAKAAALKGKKAAPLRAAGGSAMPTKPAAKPKKATTSDVPSVVTALHKAWASGDLRAGRVEMAQHLTKSGFSQNARQQGGLGGNEVRLVPGLKPQAQRNWDGVVDVRPDAASHLSQVGNLDKSSVDPATNPVANQVRVMWHEQLHGYGPGVQSTYTGVGATVEEISTEMAARRMVKDLHGIDMRQGSAWQPYAELINPIQREIAALHGVSHDQAWDVLERAALAYKKRPAGLSVDELGFAFARDIEAAGPKRGIADTLEEKLRAL